MRGAIRSPHALPVRTPPAVRQAGGRTHPGVTRRPKRDLRQAGRAAPVLAGLQRAVRQPATRPSSRPGSPAAGPPGRPGPGRRRVGRVTGRRDQSGPGPGLPARAGATAAALPAGTVRRLEPGTRSGRERVRPGPERPTQRHLAGGLSGYGCFIAGQARRRGVFRRRIRRYGLLRPGLCHGSVCRQRICRRRVGRPGVLGPRGDRPRSRRHEYTGLECSRGRRQHTGLECLR